jgi:hypothetical protein
MRLCEGSGFRVQGFRGSGFRGSGFRVQRFWVQPRRRQKTSGQIEKETDERRTSNVQHRTSNECILSILKKDLAKRFHPSKFNIRYSIFCGSLFRLAAKVASLVIEKPCHFGVVSYKRRLWPRAPSLIIEETLKKRISNIE